MLIHQSRNITGRLLLSALAMLVINSAAAAPGILADEPLQTSSSAPPNILFHLDTSGSMQHIVPEYDSSSYTYTCDNPIDGYDPADSTDSGESWSWEVCTDTNVCSSVKPRIYRNSEGEWQDFGNTSTTNCFDPNLNYFATLDADVSGAGSSVLYTGAYLNWYFNTSTDGTGDWNDNYHKPGVRTRMEVAQESLKGLVSTLTNVNVGLTTFDSSSGADLDLEVKQLDSTHLSSLLSSINGTSAGGNTPLAESTRDIGRYFANNDSGVCGGTADASLTIHPDDNLTTDTPAGRREDVDCDDMLYSRIETAGPIKYFCQKNFSVMLTDGVPTSDTSIHSKLKVYRDTDSDYWDDVTKALYEIDLRPDLNDSDGNAVTNNVITYTIGFADESVKNADLIRQAAEDAGGEFIFAEDSRALRQAFEKATRSIIAQSSTSSAVTFNSSTLSSQSAVYQALFNTVRWSGELRSIPLDGFTGEVLTNCTQGDDNCWSASAQLDAQDPDNRTILTYHPTQQEGRAFLAPADYEAPATDEVPQSLVVDLCAGPNIPHACTTTVTAEIDENQAYIEDLVAYIRGDRTNEGEGRNFRTRTTVLGDIVNASPVYVSDEPSSNWPDKPPFPETPEDANATNNSYSNWARSSIKDRAAVVYAASNDGLLHGFRTTESADNAGDAGNEVFAYVPTGTFSSNNNAGLHYLADSDYQHMFYNDLTPTISDVYIKHRDDSGTLTANPAWRTMLIGGQRGGGRTLYMLDITDPSPSAFSEANAKALVEWEFTHDDLGYSFSKPTIAMMNNGKFAAIFGNGYKSGEDGGSGDCSAKLFVVYLDGGQDGTWSPGTDYHVFDTGVGDTTDTDSCNGLSTPAVVDLTGDRTADRVYAGDLKGNLWAFDLCNFDTTNEVCQSSGWGLANASPIMTATDDANPANPQPITVKPVVSRDPADTGKDSMLITFGTGQYLTNNDKSDTSVQTMYGVREYTALTNGGEYALDPRQNNDNFIEQDIVTTTDCSTEVTGCTGQLRSIGSPQKTMNNSGNRSNGWLIDLPIAGERVVVNPAIRNNILFFNTLIPDGSVCSSGGSGWLMSVNLANGGVPEKVIFDINNDGVIDAGDKLGGDPPIGQRVGSIPAESTFLGDKQYTPDSKGNINVRDVNIGKVRREGRMSWRELFVD